MNKKKEESTKTDQTKQRITVEFAGQVISIPIYLTNVTVRDLELQKNAWLSACEEAFHEYMFINRLGRYSKIPPDDHQKSSDAASPATRSNPKK